MAVNATAGSGKAYFLERRAARQQRLAERQQTKEAKKATPDQTSEAATVNVSTDAAKTEAPKTQSKNFIGNIAGANVVNIAVQGGNGSDKIAIFSSGEGPKPVKVEEKKPEEKAPAASTEKVDTVA